MKLKNYLILIVITAITSKSVRSEDTTRCENLRNTLYFSVSNPNREVFFNLLCEYHRNKCNAKAELSEDTISYRKYKQLNKYCFLLELSKSDTSYDALSRDLQRSLELYRALEAEILETLNNRGDHYDLYEFAKVFIKRVKSILKRFNAIAISKKPFDAAAEIEKMVDLYYNSVLSYSIKTKVKQILEKQRLESRALKRFSSLIIYVTGYGPFKEIKVNPSEILANYFSSRKTELELLHPNGSIVVKYVSILKVSVSYVDRQMKKIHSMIQQDLQASKDSMILLIHIGYEPNREEALIYLENVARNEVDDDLDHQGIIDKREPSRINTKLNIRNILNKVTPFRNSFYNSFNAGTFLCNYISFRSISKYKHNDRVFTQFLHIPRRSILGTKEAFRYMLAYFDGIFKVYIK